MATKNYYMVLGVSSDESQAGIRSRYRDLARTHHPDMAGPGATEHFQEISEAYQVLGNPRRRAIHDDELKVRPAAAPKRSRPAAEPLIADMPTRSRAEPLIQEPLIQEPLSVLSNPESIHPSFAALVERFERNFTGVGVPKSEQLEGLNLEIVITPEEAVRGGLVPVAVPVFRQCTVCGGTGRDWLFPCLRCHAEGIIVHERVVNIRVPPMTWTKAVFEAPLDGLGAHNFVLRLHVRVE